MKKLLILLSTFMLLNADSVSMKTGWNLIGISTDANITKSDFTSLVTSEGATFETAVGYDGVKALAPYKLTNFEGGKGYWVKISSSSDINITWTPGNIVDPKLTLGWNLISSKENKTKAEFLSYALSSLGATIETAVSYDGVKALAPYKLTTYSTGQGYWVKVSDIAGSDSVSAPTGVDSDSTPPLVPSL